MLTTLSTIETVLGITTGPEASPAGTANGPSAEDYSKVNTAFIMAERWQTYQCDSTCATECLRYPYDLLDSCSGYLDDCNQRYLGFHDFRDIQRERRPVIISTDSTNSTLETNCPGVRVMAMVSNRS